MKQELEERLDAAIAACLEGDAEPVRQLVLELADRLEVAEGDFLAGLQAACVQAACEGEELGRRRRPRERKSHEHDRH